MIDMDVGGNQSNIAGLNPMSEHNPISPRSPSSRGLIQRA